MGNTTGTTQQRGYPNSQLHVLRAFEERWEEKGRVPFDRVAMAGQEPFRRGKIWSYLQGLGADVQDIEDAKAPELLVVGRQRVDFGDIERLLSRREGKTLRICSQEMLMAWAMTGVDPNKRPQTTETFTENHPVLREITEILGGKWPGTDPIPSHGRGDGGEFNRPDKSPLKRLGYTVGQSGETRSTRRRALRETYKTEKEDLPGTYPADYLEEWGPAESGARLKRIADHLASSCRNSRKKDGNYGLAIDHWEEDLRWLKRTFYNPLTYGFEWPSTKV